MKPLITVLMPVRDGERFLEEAIASVVAGEFADLELVAVDDGSRDSTPAILRRWAERDARVVVVTLDRPVGIAAALNRGLAVARAEYVARHDADDLFVPARVEPQLDTLRRRPDVVLVTGDRDVVDERGRHLYRERFAEAPEVMSHLLSFSNAVGTHGGVMFRRDDVLAVGGYDEEYGLSEDYELWLRLAARGRILALPMVCQRLRSHGRQTTQVEPDRVRRGSMANARRAQTALLGRSPSPSEGDAVAAIWRVDGRPCDYSAADRVFREALAKSPHRHDSGFVRRVRAITAARWVDAAARLAMRGHPGGAVACLRHGARWHPRGAIGAAGLAARKACRAAAYRARALYRRTRA